MEQNSTNKNLHCHVKVNNINCKWGSYKRVIFTIWYRGSQYERDPFIYNSIDWTAMLRLHLKVLTTRKEIWCLWKTIPSFKTQISCLQF